MATRMTCDNNMSACVSISILISVAPSIHSVQQIGESHIFFDYLIFIVVAHYYNVLRPVRDCIQLRNGQQHILLCNGVLHEPNQSFSTRYGYTYTIGVLRVSLQRKTGKWHVDDATQQITFFQCNLMQLRTHKSKRNFYQTM